MTLEASDPALHAAEKTFLLEHRFSESERLTCLPLPEEHGLELGGAPLEIWPDVLILKNDALK